MIDDTFGKEMHRCAVKFQLPIEALANFIGAERRIRKPDDFQIGNLYWVESDTFELVAKLTDIFDSTELEFVDVEMMWCDGNEFFTPTVWQADVHSSDLMFYTVEVKDGKFFRGKPLGKPVKKFLEEE